MYIYVGNSILEQRLLNSPMFQNGNNIQLHALVNKFYIVHHNNANIPFGDTGIWKTCEDNILRFRQPAREEEFYRFIEDERVVRNKIVEVEEKTTSIHDEDGDSYWGLLCRRISDRYKRVKFVTWYKKQAGRDVTEKELYDSIKEVAI